MSTTTPNMGLPVSTIGVDSGLSWEQNLNSSLNIIDQHNHTSGYGVKITPDGLNINKSLSFGNQQATSVQAIAFQQQPSLSTLNALFVGSDGNLYFNDGSGDPSIKITSGGLVNATSSGITSGTASAAFSSGALYIMDSGSYPSGQPANIGGASLLLGNGTTNSKYLTLNPPSAMGSNIAITLPNPSTSPGTVGSSSALYMDTSGNITTVAAIPLSTNLTFGSTVALDASQSQSIFYLTCTSSINPTISPPINAVDGKRIVIVFQAYSSGNTLTLSSATGGFAFGSTFTSLFPTAASTTDYIGCIYRASTNTWDVVAYVQGFAT